MNELEKAQLKKQMVIKLGTTTNDEAKVISNMVDGGSAGALPAVSSTDNGKVLTVANGAWAAGNASGGGGIFVIGSTYEEDTETLSKTWQEIYNALASGQLPVMIGTNEGGGQPGGPDYQGGVSFVIYIVGTEGTGYNLNVFMPDGDTQIVSYACSTASDYPSHTWE